MVKFSLVTGAIKRTLYVFLLCQTVTMICCWQWHYRKKFNALIIAKMLILVLLCCNLVHISNWTWSAIYRAAGMSKFWWGQANVVGIIWPSPPNWDRVNKSAKYSGEPVLASSYVPTALYCAIHDWLISPSPFRLMKQAKLEFGIHTYVHCTVHKYVVNLYKLWCFYGDLNFFHNYHSDLE